MGTKKVGFGQLETAVEKCGGWRSNTAAPAGSKLTLGVAVGFPHAFPTQSPRSPHASPTPRTDPPFHHSIIPPPIPHALGRPPTLPSFQSSILPVRLWVACETHVKCKAHVKRKSHVGGFPLPNRAGDRAVGTPNGFLAVFGGIRTGVSGVCRPPSRAW
jgi:hypothetical protein